MYLSTFVCFTGELVGSEVFCTVTIGCCCVYRVMINSCTVKVTMPVAEMLTAPAHYADTNRYAPHCDISGMVIVVYPWLVIECKVLSWALNMVFFCMMRVMFYSFLHTFCPDVDYDLLCNYLCNCLLMDIVVLLELHWCLLHSSDTATRLLIERWGSKQDHVRILTEDFDKMTLQRLYSSWGLGRQVGHRWERNFIDSNAVKFMKSVFEYSDFGSYSGFTFEAFEGDTMKEQFSHLAHKAMNKLLKFDLFWLTVDSEVFATFELIFGCMPFMESIKVEYGSIECNWVLSKSGFFTSSSFLDDTIVLNALAWVEEIIFVYLEKLQSSYKDIHALSWLQCTNAGRIFISFSVIFVKVKKASRLIKSHYFKTLKLDRESAYIGVCRGLHMWTVAGFKSRWASADALLTVFISELSAQKPRCVGCKKLHFTQIRTKKGVDASSLTNSNQDCLSNPSSGLGSGLEAFDSDMLNLLSSPAVFAGENHPVMTKGTRTVFDFLFDFWGSTG